MRIPTPFLIFALAANLTLPSYAAEKLRVLILDGRNNHDWHATTGDSKASFNACGRFDVPDKPKVEDAAYLEARQKRAAAVKALRPAMDAEWANWSVDFPRYRPVVPNYNGPDWPKSMQADQISAIRKQHASRPTPWTDEELQKSITAAAGQ